MPEKQLILVAEDEDDVRELVVMNLRRAGFSICEARNGIDALKMAREHHPDAIVLDVMMPGRDGLQVCHEIRQDLAMGRVPVIMLTAKGMPGDRIAGLETGADDYLAKPFSPKELVLRLKGLLRRAAPTGDGTELVAGPFHFDVAAVRLSVEGRPVELTLIEFKLLHLLADRRSSVVDRDVIMREVWGYSNTVRTRTLDTHVKRIREKLGGQAGWIQTARGSGYIFADPSSAQKAG